MNKTSDPDYHRKWRADHLEQSRAYSRKWAAANPIKVRERIDRWRANNPDKYAAIVERTRLAQKARRGNSAQPCLPL